MVRKKLEGFLDRDIPEQLGPLAENHPDVQGQLAPFLPGHPSQDLQLARRGHQDAGEHLEGGGFARPVFTDEAYPFPPLDGKAEGPDGLEFLHFAAKEGLHRAQKPGLALAAPVGFGKIFNLEGLFHISVASYGAGWGVSTLGHGCL